MIVAGEVGVESLSPLDSGDEQEEDTTLHNDSENEPDQILNHSNNGAEKKTSSKPKELFRPKRKKARRACFACQRAHLTCGDERPCERCIKRGLQDACHDGMRKKAKYLHDAPNEALMPGAAANYKDTSLGKSENCLRSKSSSEVEAVPMPSSVFAAREAVPYSRSSYDLSQGQMPPSLRPEDSTFSPYDQQQTILSPRFSPSRAAMMPDIMSPPLQTTLNQQYSRSLMDAADPMLFNFDTTSMNFGNHYGALEFGMLGHMSSGANNDMFMQGQKGSFDASNNAPTGMMDDFEDLNSYGLQRMTSNPDWQMPPVGQALPMHLYNTALGNTDSLRLSNHQRPLAYAIGAGQSPNFSGVSPASNTTAPEMQATYDSNNFMDASIFAQQPQQQLSFMNPPNLNRRQSAQLQQYPDPKPSEAISKKLVQLPPGAVDNRKRLKTASAVYEAVKQPYPYTQGFHALTAMLQRRFTTQKRLAIAQAMASIRPSFISCTRNLVDDDLLFMEKCFQRQLWEYQDFVNACGSPTIVCRRTGEVALVGKEFSLLTGWSKDVLLGKEPNLNTHQQPHPGTSSGQGSRSGFNTPRVPTTTNEADKTDSSAPRPQAVFLAELLDDDSVVQFYEDFAKLAFADSKGSVWSPCKLLKYKAREENVSMLPFGPQEASGRVRRTNGGMISSEEGMTKLGDKEGKIDCVYCWMVRRDVFDIPMMIVLNFLPVI